MVVALRTAACDFALPDTTTAPSMPRNSHRVTSIVACTCGMTLSQVKLRSTVPCMPQKPSMNTENLNTVATAKMKMATGSSLPMVPMMFRKLVDFAPCRASRYMIHVMMDPPMMEGMLLPPEKSGTK